MLRLLTTTVDFWLVIRTRRNMRPSELHEDELRVLQLRVANRLQDMFDGGFREHVSWAMEQGALSSLPSLLYDYDHGISCLSCLSVVCGMPDTPSCADGCLVLPLSVKFSGRWEGLPDILDMDAFHERMVTCIREAVETPKGSSAPAGLNCEFGYSPGRGLLRPDQVLTALVEDCTGLLVRGLHVNSPGSVGLHLPADTPSDDFAGRRDIPNGPWAKGLRFPSGDEPENRMTSFLSAMNISAGRL